MPVPPRLPPWASQVSAERLVLQREPQSRSVAQVSAGLPTQVSVVVSQVSVAKRQVTNPGFPQVERAAQRLIFPLQLVGMVPSLLSRRTTCATQLTYRPWLLAPSNEQSAVIAWCTA